MTLKPTPQRIEVAVGSATTFYVNTCPLRIPTNGAAGTDSTGTNWVIPNVSVSISGVPAGCTATLVDSGKVNPIGTIPVNMNTNNASLTTNLIVKLVFDGTEASGTANLIITATGGGLPEDDFIMPLDVAKIWNGSGNAAATGPGSWSDSAQWQGGALQTGDAVVFGDTGEQTNTYVNGSTYLTNSLVDTSVTISSLRFALTNANYQNLYINPGVNLAINGDGGFSALRDYSYWNKRMFINIWGAAGTLIQTNENSSFTLLFGDGQQQSILDMSGLGNLYLDVNQLQIDSYQGYPNYFNVVYTNAINGTTVGTGKPQKIYGTWNMAMTNYVRSTFVDPYNYTNALSRDYALTLGRNDGSGGGSGKDCNIFMGYSNVFNVDSICVSGPSSYGANLQFLKTNSYAKFRNSDGVSRMSVFATADLGGQGIDYSFNDKTKCGGSGPGVDFTYGTVDMLVDRLYLSMDGTTNDVATSGSFAGYSQTSGFYVGAGIIDANTAIFGYQSQGFTSDVATNNGTCYANVYVTNTAVLKVNNTMTLGYSTSPLNSGTYGRLFIGPGGTVMANSIAVGGPAKTSSGNNIALQGNANLIVSNNIADATPNGALGTLSLAGGNNTLTLFVDGNNPSPLVYVTNLTSSGTGNQIVIGNVQNLTYPAYVPLILGVDNTAPISASAFDAGVVVPAGLHGTLVTSATNSINLILVNRTPNYLLWRAPAGATGTADWDHTTKNWLDQVTGLMTNFNEPDIVSFDDAPGYATNINILSGQTLIPAAINMTNNVNYYTFVNGGGSVIGGPVFNKQGSGTVEVDANTSFNIQLNQGGLVGNSSSAVGGVTIAVGAVMNYAGAIGGNVNCAGVGTSSGSISGSLAVLGGGMMTNSGTLANPFSVAANGVLDNTSSGVMSYIGVGSAAVPQVAQGGLFVNSGSIGTAGGGNALYINGTFEDMGGVSDNMTLYSVTINAGGLFLPGGAGLGTTAINSDGTGNFPGAALFIQGSTNVFNVDLDTPANTLLTADHISYGGSSSARSQNGCTIQINNLGSPFSAGQSFQLFNNEYVSGTPPFNTGTSTNTYPVITPETPGPGLAWDLTKLWVNGSVGIVPANSGPVFTKTFTFVGGTNIVGQFSWDPSYLGYRLQTLVTPNTVGLNIGTNYSWSGINGSWTNNSILITNKTGTNDVGTGTYYRLTFP